MEQYILELIKTISAPVVVLFLGRWIFNSVIRRVEDLEKANTKLLEAITSCNLSSVKERVAKEDCVHDKKDIKKWIGKVEEKVS